VHQLLKIDFDNRIFGLDLLRFFAIFYVMNRHANDLILPFANKQFLKVFELDGVTLFFVLSGFLIGRILLKIYFAPNKLRWKDLKHFWMRRWLRTIPPYFLVLTLLVVVKLIQGNPFQTMYLQFYGFVQNLWYPHPPFFGEAYSISVEEWFYFIFPLLLFVMAIACRQRSKPVFLLLLFFFITLSIACRSYITFNAYQMDIPILSLYKHHIQKIVVTRFDSLMLGVLAAYLLRFYPKIWNRYKGISFFLGLMCLLAYKLFPWVQFPALKAIAGLILLSVGVVLLLPMLNAMHRVEGKLAKFVSVISVVSYAMYLINLTLRQVLIDYLPSGTAIHAYFKYFLFWILSIIASIIFYRIIEWPVLKYRDQLFRKQEI